MDMNRNEPKSVERSRKCAGNPRNLYKSWKASRVFSFPLETWAFFYKLLPKFPVDHLVDTITVGERRLWRYPSCLSPYSSRCYHQRWFQRTCAAGGGGRLDATIFFFSFLFFLFYSSLGQQASFFRALCLCEIKGDLAGDSLIPLTPSNVYLLLLFVS